MKYAASVIVCTHNPRPDYLRATLESLRKQTFPADEFELIVIDNASEPALSAHYDLAWHPHARIIREQELGLTSARLRGIKESKGELIIFVDDDNVLASDYIEVALGHAAKHSHIGVFGGSIHGEFEVPPPDWAKPYLPGLAVEEISRNYWSNLPVWSKAVPYGAGACARRSVAEEYAGKVVNDSRRRALGRKGAALGAGDDSDLAWCAIDLGMGTARFCDLRMTHLIPRGRLTETFIAHLYAGFAASEVILASVRGDAQRVPKSFGAELRSCIRHLFAPRIRRRIWYASLKSTREAFQIIGKAGNFETRPGR